MTVRNIILSHRNKFIIERNILNQIDVRTEQMLIIDGVKEYFISQNPFHHQF